MTLMLGKHASYATSIPVKSSDFHQPLTSSGLAINIPSIAVFTEIYFFLFRLTFFFILI